ncbi:MAG: 30S ribosomal protein S20 [Clostridiales bacterium]|nr:30S ribosomal protein S20 [Clostridiales bacterium]
MPNIKSSAKRAELSKVWNLENKSKKSALRTSIKKFDAAVVEGNKNAAAQAYHDATKLIDRAAGNGLLHKNNAARKKSRLAKTLNTMTE